MVLIALYAKSMLGPMPVGIPFFYEPRGDGFFAKTLCSERKDFSWEALDWLNYMSDDPRFANTSGGFHTIRCIINGEKRVKTSAGEYRVDGYVETSDQIYLLEYNGCRYHSCDKCMAPTLSDTRARDSKKFKALQEIGIVIVMWGCEWQRLRRRLRTRISPFSAFFYERKISSVSILAAIQNETFFGIANCDIYAPDNVKEKYREINFPPLFKRAEHLIEDLEPEMAAFYEAYGTKPSPQLTVGFSADEISLSTDYIKFLLDAGFRIRKLNWALEYQKGNISYKILTIILFNS